MKYYNRLSGVHSEASLLSVFKKNLDSHCPARQDKWDSWKFVFDLFGLRTVKFSQSFTLHSEKRWKDFQRMVALKITLKTNVLDEKRNTYFITHTPMLIINSHCYYSRSFFASNVNIPAALILHFFTNLPTFFMNTEILCHLSVEKFLGEEERQKLFSSFNHGFNHGCNRECKMTDSGWLNK